MRAGIDTGGTFTDLVAEDGGVRKVLSTPDDPAAAVGTALADLDIDVVAHGTTVATNALLQRRGGVVALITNKGFGDLIEIGRQDRPSLYDPFADRPQPLVPRELRFEVAGRIDANGHEIEALETHALAIPTEVDCVAVTLLHADLNAKHEAELVEYVEGLGFDVTASHAVAPEFREYERTSTTVINAYLRKPCRSYLQSLRGVGPKFSVMTSAGGLMPIEVAAAVPARLLLSGPAGGVLAAAGAARAAGFDDAVTLDMGGTSTDVCLVRGGVPEPGAQRVVGGLPLRLPSLDIHTIGAGGGSIARIDRGGALAVGPRSAGAAPGPACYGLGGDEPTVTDADLVAGRIPIDATFPGLGRLDVNAARAALARAGVDADGVIAVVDEAMVQAIRAVTVARGVDPRTTALVAFGGAGPLHACALASRLGMPAVIVPSGAGVLSAAGLLAAPHQEDRVRSWPNPLDREGLSAAIAQIVAEASAALGGGTDVEVEFAVDCRYAGQSHELTVVDVREFPAEHERRNGYTCDAPVEVVALRATARVLPPLRTDAPAPTSRRAPTVGPAVVAEPDCTLWVPEGWRADVHPRGSWVITRWS